MKRKFSKDFLRIVRAADKILGKLMGCMNLIFCDDKTSHDLNRKYRKRDKPTDVLTFTIEKTAKNNQGLVAEIYLDAPYIKRQTKEDHEAFSLKMHKLFIHGLLHARGYDHKKNRDERIMKLLEEKILKGFFFSKEN